jgi:hypothetical protein
MTSEVHEVHQEFADEQEREIDPVYFNSHFDFNACEKASLPAALCATSYAPNCWAFDVAAGVADPVAWIGEEQFEKDRDALARSLMVASRCRPLEVGDLLSGERPTLAQSSKAFGGRLVRGVFRKGDLCQALVSEAFNELGEKELHLCIRGTDLDNNPNKYLSAFQALVGYAIWTYPRIEKHAEHFVELAQAAAARASDPANGISRLVISGHSLGASAAQSLIGRLTGCSAPVRLVTFGSPGTGSGWLAPLDKMIKSARKGARFGLAQMADLAAPAPEFNGLGSKVLSAFSALAVRCSEFFKRPLPKSGPPEQLHFRHPNDPVAKYGALAYKIGQAASLAMDPREFDRAQEGQELLVSGIGAHACSRYFRSIQGMLSKCIDEVTPWKDSSFEMKSWAAATVEALRLEMAIHPDQAAKAVMLARRRNIDVLVKLDAQDPSLARMRLLPEPSALPAKISNRRKLRKIQAALSAPGVFAAGLQATQQLIAPWSSKPAT